jgi:hypothetical protein
MKSTFDYRCAPRAERGVLIVGAVTPRAKSDQARAGLREA